MGQRAAKWLKHLRITLSFDEKRWRATSVSAAAIRSEAMHAGLACTGQEIFKWVGCRYETDCISVFRNIEPSSGTYHLYHNQAFQSEIRIADRLRLCYGHRTG
jgi:hypothetical protein